VSAKPEQWALVHEKLHELRGRYQRAKAAGQVELHLSLDTVDFLLSLAQPTVNAGLKRAGLAPAGGSELGGAISIVVPPKLQGGGDGKG
jgi:hypothetical protein